MPVFSYLAYPVSRSKEQLLKDLAALDFCEVTPAENEELLILVTDTPDEETEEKLQQKLKSIMLVGVAFSHEIYAALAMWTCGELSRAGTPFEHIRVFNQDVKSRF
jgi:nitrate reductase NapAB chaperone NapD